MKIHFVCTGNTYRSRLAATYMNSKQISGVEISSSGVCAERNLDGAITRYAERIIKNEGLVEFMAPMWTQTTSDLLNTSDKIIFMEEFHLEYSRKHFGFSSDNYQIWNVKDMTSDNLNKPEAEVIKMSENTFKKIKSNVDEFIKTLRLSK